MDMDSARLSVFSVNLYLIAISKSLPLYHVLSVFSVNLYLIAIFAVIPMYCRYTYVYLCNTYVLSYSVCERIGYIVMYIVRSLYVCMMFVQMLVGICTNCQYTALLVGLCFIHTSGCM